MPVVLGALIAGNLSAQADSGNPFGFETNKHPLEYEYCKKEPSGYRGHGYKCSSAPRPHPDFEEYALQFVEDVGLCFIAARHQPKPFTKPKDMFEMFHRQIAKKYGPPSTRKIARPDRREDSSYEWGPSQPVDTRRDRGNKAIAEDQSAIADTHITNEYLRANKAISGAQTAIGIIKRRLENHESVPVERRSVVDEDEIAKLRRDLVHNQDVLNRASKHIEEFWAVPREAGFKGLGDVKAIELVLRSRSRTSALDVHFWLVINDACQKEIDDKADHAF